MTTFIPPARRTLPIAVARKAAQALPLLAELSLSGAGDLAAAARACASNLSRCTTGSTNSE
jgi:hypothetical protein